MVSNMLYCVHCMSLARVITLLLFFQTVLYTTRDMVYINMCHAGIAMELDFYWGYYQLYIIRNIYDQLYDLIMFLLVYVSGCTYILVIFGIMKLEDMQVVRRLYGHYSTTRFL